MTRFRGCSLSPVRRARMLAAMSVIEHRNVSAVSWLLGCAAFRPSQSYREAVMAIDRESLHKIVESCIALSAKTDDVETAAELLKISYQLLQLGSPALPSFANIDAFNREQMFGAH
jgi:hypothetical protein